MCGSKAPSSNAARTVERRAAKPCACRCSGTEQSQTRSTRFRVSGDPTPQRDGKHDDDRDERQISHEQQPRKPLFEVECKPEVAERKPDLRQNERHTEE